MSTFEEEFDCIECGRHIVRFTQAWPDKLCAECMHLPGWYTDPELRQRLDSTFDPPKSITKS